MVQYETITRVLSLGFAERNVLMNFGRLLICSLLAIAPTLTRVSLSAGAGTGWTSLDSASRAAQKRISRSPMRGDIAIT